MSLSEFEKIGLGAAAILAGLLILKLYLDKRDHENDASAYSDLTDELMQLIRGGQVKAGKPEEEELAKKHAAAVFDTDNMPSILVNQDQMKRKEGYHSYVYYSPYSYNRYPYYRYYYRRGLRFRPYGYSWYRWGSRYYYVNNRLHYI